MKDLIFKAEEISVKLSYFNEASKVIDSLSDNVKYCVIADAKVLDMHQDFRNGLRTLKAAVSNFREHELASEVTKEMAAAFEDLFLNDLADRSEKI